MVSIQNLPYNTQETLFCSTQAVILSFISNFFISILLLFAITCDVHQVKIFLTCMFFVSANQSNLPLREHKGFLHQWVQKFMPEDFDFDPNFMIGNQLSWNVI